MSIPARGIPLVWWRHKLKIFMPGLLTHSKNAQLAEVNRSERVTWLLGGVIALSLVDLFLTMTYLTTVGMSEGNPIAVWLLHTTDSVWPLALYKLATVAVCVSLLYHNRNKRQSELASWCAMMILVALSVWWNHYSRYQPFLPYSEDHIVMVDDNFVQPFLSTRDKSTIVQ
jgi:hypothetical protein